MGYDSELKAFYIRDIEKTPTYIQGLESLALFSQNIIDLLKFPLLLIEFR